MGRKMIIERFYNYLLEAGGVKKAESIKFYTPELMVRDKKTKVEYEISEIDKSQPEKPVFKLFRFDTNGKRFEVTKSADEILKDFEHV